MNENDPSHKNVQIAFRDFRYQSQVARFAAALNKNEYVDEFWVWFFDTGDRIISLNWDPILRELATREKLEKMKIESTPMGGLLPLFRDHFFQALQQNTNIRKLCLQYIRFSKTTAEGLASVLDRAPNLTHLSLSSCGVGERDATIARSIATSLQRNNHIQNLSFIDGCSS